LVIQPEIRYTPKNPEAFSDQKTEKAEIVQKTVTEIVQKTMLRKRSEFGTVFWTDSGIPFSGQILYPFSGQFLESRFLSRI
jgi:hypothetical protein